MQPRPFTKLPMSILSLIPLMRLAIARGHPSLCSRFPVRRGYALKTADSPEGASSVEEDGVSSDDHEGARDRDMFAAAVGGTVERRDFHSWYKQTRERLCKGKAGPVFLGGTHPFPYNPEFKPQPPLADQVKDRIFTTWRDDPTKWTPRQLSLRFKVSIERAKAIVHMKSVQTKMVGEGFLINRKYVQRMEANLGCSKAITFSEPASSAQADLGKTTAPKLVAVPKDQPFTPAEAARLLGRRLAPLYAVVREEVDGNRPFDPHPDHSIKITDEERQSLYIKKDPYEVSRWQFVFTDTSTDPSPPEQNRFLVRERDGTLRWAHETERARQVRLGRNSVPVLKSH